MTKLSLAAIFICALGIHLKAQTAFEGLLNIEYQQGEANSQYTVNGVRTNTSSVFVNSFQLFVDKEFGERVSASAVLDASLYTSTRQYQLRLYQASVTFFDLFGTGANFEAGKIRTSFGRSSRVLFSFDNPLTALPLHHQYYSPVSRLRGYLPVAPDARAEEDLGLPIVSIAPYFGGAKLYGGLLNGVAEYDIGVFNQSISNYWSELDLNKNYAFAGRIGIRPAVWGALGVSYQGGAYLDRNAAVNGFLDLNKYRQTALGADVNLNMYYYDLTVEYIQNNWRAPYIKKDALTGKEMLIADNLDLKNRAFSATLKIDIPFVPGLYLAGRYDRLTYGSITNPDDPAGQIEWNYGVKKTELGAGYKIAQGLTAKAGYQFTRRDGFTLKKFDALIAQLSIRL